MESVIVSAPAKINWTLDITGINESGYHVLDMLMQRISLFDAVRIKKTAGEIKLSSDEYWLPTDSRNTAYKAASLFFKCAEGMNNGGAEIYIKKNIPSGAGLAGGSADAAAVLAGLNRLYGYPVCDNELKRIALNVGADVPFMLNGVCSRAQGIGEILTDISPVGETLLLVMKRRESASTKEVYAGFDTVGAYVHPQTDLFTEALCKREYARLNALGGNVLTQAACRIAPGIGENLEIMKNSGALFTSMTGSGSVVFGVFNCPEEAKTAAEKFPPKTWRCVCRTIDFGLTVCDLIE